MKAFKPKIIALFVFLGIFLLGGIWIINLIWFRPFNIYHFYDRVMVEVAVESPELSTQLGIPVLSDMYNDELTDISQATLEADREKVKENLKTLQAYSRDNQDPETLLNTDIFTWWLKNQIEGFRYDYHDYPVNQMIGVPSNLPNMLKDTHQINDKEDAEAYTSRLSKFPVKFGQLIEGLKIREEKGVIPPKFVIEKVISQLSSFTGQKLDSLELDPQFDPIKANILYSSFEEKIRDKEFITEEERTELLNRAYGIIQDSVIPSYAGLIKYFELLDQKANNDAGVWKLPEGEDYYRYRLKSNTTLDLDPEEVHQLGLKEVDRISKEMREILVSQGYTDTALTLGEVFEQLNQEERFTYPAQEGSKQEIIDRYQQLLDHISENLDEVFDLRPKAGMVIREVPVFQQEGRPGASYLRPAIDGSRPGIFYINLRDVTEIKKYGMATLAYHEGIPGHHFQIAIQMEIEDAPIFRNVLGFTAFSEGWALYAEYLAWELGFYKDDPFGDLGRLQAEMFRAVRLVVDTGIHFKRWGREPAIEYMVTHTGMPRSELVTEIERYIIMPGQACAYKIGMLKILELREKARDQLGDGFDLKEFHNLVLSNGAVPLEILEQIVDNYVSQKLES